MNPMEQKINQYATQYDELALRDAVIKKQISIQELQKYIGSSYASEKGKTQANVLINRINAISNITRGQTAQVKRDISTNSEQLSKKNPQPLKNSPKQKNTVQLEAQKSFEQLKSTSKELLSKAGLNFKESFKLTAKAIGFSGKEYNQAFVDTLQKYQKENNLSVDGILGQEVLISIIAGDIVTLPFAIATFVKKNIPNKQLEKFLKLSNHNKEFLSFHKATQNGTVNEAEKQNFLATFSNLSPESDTMNYLGGFVLIEKYKDKFPNDKAFAETTDTVKSENTVQFEKALADQSKGTTVTVTNPDGTVSDRSLIDIANDDKMLPGDKFSAFMSSGLGAGAFVAFIGMLLFTDKIIGGSFWKKLGGLAFGVVAYSYAKDDVVKIMNDMAPKKNKGSKSTTSSISDGVTNAIENAKDGISNLSLPDSIKNVLGVGKELSTEVYTGLHSMVAQNTIFKGDKSFLDETIKEFAGNSHFNSLDIEGITNQGQKLTNDQLTSIGFSKNSEGNLIKEIVVGSVKKTITAEEFNSQFIAALVAAKGSAEKIGDIFEKKSFIDVTKTYTKEAWTDSTESSKIIAGGIGAALLGMPIVGPIIAGVGISKNLTASKFMQEVFGRNEYALSIEQISDNVEQIKDPTLKKEVLDLFSEIGKDKHTLDKLKKLTSEAKGPDKAVLKKLKPLLAVNVSRMLNNGFSRFWEEVARLTNDEVDLMDTYQKVVELENTLTTKEYTDLLSKEQIAKIQVSIISAKKRLEGKIVEAGGDIITSSESKGEKAGVFVGVINISNTSIQKEIKARLEDLKISENTQLMHKLTRILSQGDIASQLAEVEKLRPDYGINVSYQDVASLLAVAHLESESMRELNTIILPSSMTVVGMNHIAQKLNNLSTSFAEKKAAINFDNYAFSINSSSSYSTYTKAYNEKLKSLINYAKTQSITSIAWGNESKSITAIEQEIITAKKLEKNRIKLPDALSKLNNALTANKKLDDILTKFGVLLNVPGFKVEDHNELMNSVTEKVEASFAVYIKYKDATDISLISLKEKGVLLDLKNAITKHGTTLLHFSSGLAEAHDRIVEILIQKKEPKITSPGIVPHHKTEGTNNTKRDIESKIISNIPNSKVKDMLEKIHQSEKFSLKEGAQKILDKKWKFEIDKETKNILKTLAQ